MRKYTSLRGSCAPSTYPSRVPSPGNTPPETFLHSAADTKDPQSTPTQKDKAPEVQMMEPTPMKSLVRLSANPDSEEDESEPADDEPESEPASPDAKKTSNHLQTMYQKLYSVKATNNFADGWHGFAENTASIDKATQAKQPVIPGHYPSTSQKPLGRVPAPQDPPFVPEKSAGILGYAQDFAQSLLPRTEIFRELHAAATGSSSTVPQHKPLFPGHQVATTKPPAPIPARASAPSMFSRPIEVVTAPAQSTSRPTPSHTTPAA